MDPETLAKLTPDQKDQIMRQVQSQVALAQMQELLTVRIWITYIQSPILTLSRLMIIMCIVQHRHTLIGTGGGVLGVITP